jgi:hypothetical protein
MSTTKKTAATTTKTVNSTVPAGQYQMQGGLTLAQGSTVVGPQTTSLGNYTATTVQGTGTTGYKGIPTSTTEYMQPDITTTAYITNRVYQNLMGRDATASEIAQYHQQFSDYAKTHPILVRNAVYDPTSGVPYAAVRDVTAEKNPLAEEDFITNIVRQGPDSKAYQAATGYMDAMTKAMSQFGGGF